MTHEHFPAATISCVFPDIVWTPAFQATQCRRSLIATAAPQAVPAHEFNIFSIMTKTTVVGHTAHLREDDNICGMVMSNFLDDPAGPTRF